MHFEIIFDFALIFSSEESNFENPIFVFNEGDKFNLFRDVNLPNLKLMSFLLY